MFVKIEDEVNRYLNQCSKSSEEVCEESLYRKVIEISKLAEEIGNDVNDINMKEKSNSEILKEIYDIKSKEAKIINEVMELKIKNKKLKYRENNILAAIINILDSLEWIFKYDFKTEALNNSIKLTEKKIKKELQKINLVEVACVGDFFDEEHQICLSYKEDGTLEDNMIYDVIKKGYKVGDSILREAEVVVINNVREEKK